MVHGKITAIELSALRWTIQTSLITGATMIAAFMMSYLAEPAVQETGWGSTFLGYNRDLLVDGRWWFFSAFVACLATVFLSLKKLR
jgi:hypothetical protein